MAGMDITEITDNELGDLAKNRLFIIKDFFTKNNPIAALQDCIDQLKEILREYEDRIQV